MIIYWINSFECTLHTVTDVRQSAILDFICGGDVLQSILKI